jgi:2-polyprenyl-6-methoxyphenol hydroxylase-like FAD-dependent oxidoreductase
MMLGYLLAMSGVEVVVLEKHADFLRDFRGDTLHPSTLQVLTELGLDGALLELPHQKLARIEAHIGDRTATVADFGRVPTKHRFIAMMPQWDFLDFLARNAARFAGFDLLMETEAADLLMEAGTVKGVRARQRGAETEIHADLVVGADGRNSVLRGRAGLALREYGAPVDVLWFRLSRVTGDPEEAFGRIGAGYVMVLLNRGSHWQCGFVIPKGDMAALREGGLDAFREKVAQAAPFASNRLDEIGTWDDVALLTVRIDRLRRWYRPGLLFIGDAAHAMSPVGGVGINLAIQDAVATANLLAPSLRLGGVTVNELRKVQRRRSWPARLTQAAQVRIHNGALRPAVLGSAPGPPVAVRLLAQFTRLPADQRLNGRLLGLGVRPEHVRIPVPPTRSE